MECPRCHAQLPEVAHFCQVCGQDMRTGDLARRRSFAVKPDEPVASFALISSIMPRGVADRPQTYRIALTLALVVALVAAIFGALPIALLVAAFSIPAVYIVYLYDVNLWEDEPIPVTALAFGLTGVLALVYTIVIQAFTGPIVSVATIDGAVVGGPSVSAFLVLGILVPLVGEAIRQIGPIVLARRPEFDDLMDGLTFGVISGVAYACFDTLVRYWSLLTGGLVERDPGLWVSLIFLHGFVKPLIMGTATGIACAEFSGLGRGYDGFTPRYFRGLLEAVVANIAFQSGTYLFSFVGDDTLAVILSVAWGLIILGILILRVRNVLHVGLMEAALERSAREGMGDDVLEFCAQCEMPLVQHAAFCNACGTAVRVQPKAHHAKPDHPDAGPTAAAVAGDAESTLVQPGPMSVATQERPDDDPYDSEASGPAVGDLPNPEHPGTSQQPPEPTDRGGRP